MPKYIRTISLIIICLFTIKSYASDSKILIDGHTFKEANKIISENFNNFGFESFEIISIKRNKDSINPFAWYLRNDWIYRQVKIQITKDGFEEEISCKASYKKSEKILFINKCSLLDPNSEPLELSNWLNSEDFQIDIEFKIN